ncbi:hypothetical protein [Acerihabitans sp. TG2]|uniref:hypothetical protein n=1 Tax=Acerihabitans sp. TG2 TaxID=3096008 RepID=UPI003A5987B5
MDWFVAMFGKLGSMISPLLGDKSIDQHSALPKAVKNALHLVAAHENRVWRSIYRLGGKNEKHQEELLPGCSEDVGGGLKPDEQKPSAELSKVALHRMYRVATMAGVPFMDFRTLNKTDINVASYFLMQDSVKKKSVAHWTTIYQQAVPYKKLSVTALNYHLDSYIEWLGKQYYQYCSECMKYQKQSSQVLLLSGVSAGLGMTQQEQQTLREFQHELHLLQKNWGWLDDVHSAAVGMRNCMEMHSRDTRRDIVPQVYKPALRRAKIFLEYAHTAYQGLPLPCPDDHAPPELFAWFVHDVQTVDRGARISQDFLVIRPMETPSD